MSDRIEELEQRIAELEDNLAFAVAKLDGVYRTREADDRLNQIKGSYVYRQGPPSMIGSKRKTAA